eukprot:6656812-Pyramimonas_sp.AAC.1
MLSSRSVVAGSPRGVGLAKLFLHPILDMVHGRSPAAGLWTFVDDATARCEGSRASVGPAMVTAAMDLKAGLEDQRMIISSKTVLIGSNPSITRRVAGQLRARGLPVSAVTEA